MGVYNGASAAAALVTDTSTIYNSSDASGGCNGFGHSVASPYSMPIAGTYLDNWGANVGITSSQWTSVSSSGSSSTYAIEMYTNNLIVMQNPATASYNPSLWTKVQFHTVGSGFGYCSSVYNGASAADALMADTSTIYNSSDASGGCNGFGHSVASPYSMPIAGTYLDNWGTYVIIINDVYYSGTSAYAIE